MSSNTRREQLVADVEEAQAALEAFDAYVPPCMAYVKRDAKFHGPYAMEKFRGKVHEVDLDAYAEGGGYLIPLKGGDGTHECWWWRSESLVIVEGELPE